MLPGLLPARPRGFVTEAGFSRAGAGASIACCPVLLSNPQSADGPPLLLPLPLPPPPSSPTSPLHLLLDQANSRPSSGQGSRGCAPFGIFLAFLEDAVLGGGGGTSSLGTNVLLLMQMNGLAA